MNKPGDSMDEFGVPVVGSYIDGDRYAVFDVEDILYNVGLVNYKDNNEGTYKVIWPYAVCDYVMKNLTKESLAN